MSWRLKWRSLWNRNLQADLDDELKSHIEMKARELAGDGLPPDCAQEEARRRFGNMTQTAEQVRDQHVFAFWEAILQDVRYGCRVLRRQPLFTLAAVLTLGLVIGANGAIFSLLEAVLLRPLPYPHSEQLAILFGNGRKGDVRSISPVDLEDWRQASSFAGISAFQGQSVNLTGVEEPTRLIGGFVSSNFFSILQVAPRQGRNFAAGEDKAGAPRVCIVSHGFWQDRFGRDPHMLGRSLILNGEAFTVVGILPASFRPAFLRADVWMPVQHYPDYAFDRGRESVIAIGRLASGSSFDRARAQLNTITRRLAAEFPATNQDRGAQASSLHEYMVADLRPILQLLAGAAACVLLIGCANVAALLLTKSAGRTREMAIRASLGAGNGRLVRQLLTESILLALMGGALGLALAHGGATVLAAYSDDIPKELAVGVDTPVLLFLLAVSVVMGLLFGLAPAIAARREAASALRQRGPVAIQGRMKAALVVVQVALALVLLAGAGLMMKSLRRLTGIDPGFRTDRILTLEYRLPRNKYPAGAQQTQFHQEVVERVASVPGVESAGIIRGLPFSGNSGTANITLPDRPEPPRESPFVTFYNAVTPTYFATVGMPVLAGRGFRASDGPETARVVIVSRSFVKRYWPGKEAVGKQVRIPAADGASEGRMTTATVVGVVADIKHDALEESSQPQLYVAYAQDPIIFATLAVRTKGEPLSLTRAVQRAVWSVDKDQPMWKIRTLDSLVERSTSPRRAVFFLLSCFSVLAMGLAAIGLYGVLAYGVSQRSAEFGVRLAMGALPVQVLTLVLRQGLVLVCMGLAIGIGASLGLSRFLESQLYQVSAMDPAVYGWICALLFLTAAGAAFLPARRAMRLDPAVALRHE